MSRVRLVHVLSENWTLTPPRDLRALVRMAQEAEDAGFDAVMLSEHVVLGRGADVDGLMANPRDYALPGTRIPRCRGRAPSCSSRRSRRPQRGCGSPPRRSSLHSGIRSSSRRISRPSICSPKGRLVVLPTVSWHEAEYEAIGVPFARRGALLDEHLAAWHAVWSSSPASFAGRFYRFDDVWLEPKPFRDERVRLWFGSSTMHDRLIERLVRYGDGWNPLGRPSDEDIARLRAALADAGRDLADLELVGGTRGRFPDADSVADLDEALATIPAQLERGFTSICIKPSQFLDDPTRHAAWCHDVVAKVEALTA